MPQNVLSSSKEIRKLVAETLKKDSWTLQIGRGKHKKLLHSSGKWLPIPFSPSCRRAVLNLKADIFHIEQHGAYRKW